WHSRWFVLQGQQLYYYKDQEEARILGTIFLPGNRVLERAATIEERFLFEIAPGLERARTTTNHETVLLMAGTRAEMESWVRALRRAIGVPFRGGVFGRPLEEAVRRVQHSASPIPPIIARCAAFIRQRGLNEEGLFRQPGQTRLVRCLKQQIDSEDEPCFDKFTDVHSVASLMKLYLRELPQPLVPFDKYAAFLACSRALVADRQGAIDELLKQINGLSPASYNLLCFICRFLYEVQKHEMENKMNIQNLAMVFAPNILRKKTDDPFSIMEGAAAEQQLVEVLISEHAWLFPQQPPSESPESFATTREEIELQTAPEKVVAAAAARLDAEQHLRKEREKGVVEEYEEDMGSSECTERSPSRRILFPKWGRFEVGSSEGEGHPSGSPGWVPSPERESIEPSSPPWDEGDDEGSADWVSPDLGSPDSGSPPRVRHPRLVGPLKLGGPNVPYGSPQKTISSTKTRAIVTNGSLGAGAWDAHGGGAAMSGPVSQPPVGIAAPLRGPSRRSGPLKSPGLKMGLGSVTSSSTMFTGSASVPRVVSSSGAHAGQWVTNGFATVRPTGRRTSSDEGDGRSYPGVIVTSLPQSSQSVQRLSAYDNVLPGLRASPGPTSEDYGSIDSATCSTSSWEATGAPLPLPPPPPPHHHHHHHHHHPAGPLISHSGGASEAQGQTGWLACPHWGHDANERLATTMPPSTQISRETRVEMVEVCVRSRVSVPPIPPAQPYVWEPRGRGAVNIQHGTLQNMIASLKAELNQQRNEYELRIRRLEQANGDLISRVERLSQDLEQERARHRMATIKLRNAERARNDAERRNEVLQREMEQFFALLGELGPDSSGTRPELPSHIRLP
uniref:rho GTPase-activating protein 24-like n=1 Tax=Myxine glutinosa TaxID=7769 RepID=UPI00358EB816